MSLEEEPWNCLLYGHSKYILMKPYIQRIHLNTAVLCTCNWTMLKWCEILISWWWFFTSLLYIMINCSLVDIHFNCWNVMTFDLCLFIMNSYLNIQLSLVKIDCLTYVLLMLEKCTVQCNFSIVHDQEYTFLLLTYLYKTWEACMFFCISPNTNMIICLNLTIIKNTMFKLSFYFIIEPHIHLSKLFIKPFWHIFLIHENL